MEKSSMVTNMLAGAGAAAALAALFSGTLQVPYLHQWPAWAVNPFLATLIVFSLVYVVQKSFKDKQGDEDTVRKTRASVERDKDFSAFQRQWLTVYFITMLADWLQGTHMYTLYAGYDQPVGTLFGIGFTSSAIFGTFLGFFVDKYGRKLGCIVFCVLELIINVLEHFNNFELLVLGRVLGGMSTSLLFTAFESWMVSEHRKRGFEEKKIAHTFAIAQMGNGAMAVLAGVLAQVSAEQFGDIGPFQLAIALTAVALVFVCFWNENYGGDGKQSSSSDLLIGDAMNVIKKDTKILLLGLIQSLFEGAMYTFVIMWVPTLARMVPGGKSGQPDFAVFGLGQGWIFSAMMVCISIGGEVFEGILKITTVEAGSIFIFLLAAASMVVPILFNEFYMVLGAFLILEACVGASFGAMATMRSHLLPDALQASIMNIFRLPLNILVVTGARMGDVLSPPQVFGVVLSWFLASGVLQIWLNSLVKAKKKTA